MKKVTPNKSYISVRHAYEQKLYMNVAN